MPRYLFAPTARSYPKLNFKTVEDVAGINEPAGDCHPPC